MGPSPHSEPAVRVLSGDHDGDAPRWAQAGWTRAREGKSSAGRAACGARGGPLEHHWPSAAYTPTPTPVSGMKAWLVFGSTATECAFFAVGMFSIHVWVRASMMPRTGPPGLARAAR